LRQTLHRLVHPPEERRLIAPVCIEPAVRMLGDDLKELLVEPGLLSRGISPERLALLHRAGLYYHAEQVHEPAVWIALKIKVNPGGTDWQLRGAIDVDFLVADGESL
jgi:hypothetical protein